MSAAPVPKVRVNHTLRRREGPLRVLFVTHSFAPIGRALDNLGGMQRTAQDLHAALCRAPGLEVHTQALRTSGRLANLRTPGYVAWLARTLPETIETRAIDVVLFTSLVTAASAVPIAASLRARGVRLASIVHGRAVTRRSGVLRWVLPRVFASLDAVYPVSTGTAAKCRARGLPEARMAVVPNGVDLTRFGEPADRLTARSTILDATRPARKGRPDPELIVCSVGRHIERKGFGWFVREVMPALPSGVEFWLAGEGPATEKIRREVQHAGLERRVTLLGRLSDRRLRLLYQGADLFVMPNVAVAGDFEGFGVVMLEAGASGLPVVAARLEGITDVVEEGETGCLVESGDARGFVEAIERYRVDREALRSDGRRAAAVVRRRSGWEQVAGQYATQLRRLIGAAEDREPTRGSA